jgi:hypothetical protein
VDREIVLLPGALWDLIDPLQSVPSAQLATRRLPGSEPLRAPELARAQRSMPLGLWYGGALDGHRDGRGREKEAPMDVTTLEHSDRDKPTASIGAHRPARRRRAVSRTFYLVIWRRACCCSRRLLSDSGPPTSDPSSQGCPCPSGPWSSFTLPCSWAGWCSCLPRPPSCQPGVSICIGNWAGSASAIPPSLSP